MLSISHSLTASLIAVTLQHPAVVIPAIFASHYLEDWIPHWDVGTGLSKGTRKRRDAILMEFGELGITVILVYVFFQHGQAQLNWLAWGGAFVGLIPDFLEAPRNFLKWEPAFIRPLNQLHGFFHHSTPNILVGLTPQVLLWIAIWFLKP